MKMLIILLIGIFALILMSLNTLASLPYDGSQKTGNETFNVGISGNWSKGDNSVDALCAATGGWMNCTGSQAATYIHQLINVSTNTRNFTMFEGDMIIYSGDNNPSQALTISYTNMTNSSGGGVVSIALFKSTNMFFGEPGISSIDVTQGITNNGTMKHIQLIVNNSAILFYSDDVYIGAYFWTSVTPPLYFGVGNTNNYFSRGSQTVAINNFVSYNSSTYDFTNLLTSPNISLTSLINTPLNNSQTHNATPNINFTIIAGTYNNISFSVFLDTNNPPVTIINSSNFTLQGNFTINFFTIPLTIDSLNGTYYLKINGSDNMSNFFSQTISFNLTNNISNYNVTNVTFLPTPILAGNQITGYCNITSYSVEKNNQSLINRLWYVNGTQLTTNINSTTLDGTNVTGNSNTIFSCRVNNGYGETAWTQWFNSSTVTTNDITPPTINSFSISSISPLTTDIVNITANVSDNIAVNSVKVTVDAINFSMINLGDIWQYPTTWALGHHNISYFIATDGSLNQATNTSTINFTVTSPSSGGGYSGGGGGGSITEITIINQMNQTPILSFGIATLSFFVVATPSQSQKLIVFKNYGNVSLDNVNVHIEGQAKAFLTAQICDLNRENCKREGIFIKGGENALLEVFGNFNDTLGIGSEGVIRIENSKTFDLPVIIERPPLYASVIYPIKQRGYSEGQSYLLGLTLVGITSTISVFIIKVIWGV